jgi:hypothetical protein
MPRFRASSQLARSFIRPQREEALASSRCLRKLAIEHRALDCAVRARGSVELAANVIARLSSFQIPSL